MSPRHQGSPCTPRAYGGPHPGSKPSPKPNPPKPNPNPNANANVNPNKVDLVVGRPAASGVRLTLNLRLALTLTLGLTRTRTRTPNPNPNPSQVTHADYGNKAASTQLSNEVLSQPLYLTLTLSGLVLSLPTTPPLIPTLPTLPLYLTLGARTLAGDHAGWLGRV